MFEQLDDLEAELERLERDLPEIYAAGDRRGRARRGSSARRAEAARRRVPRRGRGAEPDLADARELLGGEADAEMRDYLKAEIAEKEAQLDELDAEIRELLLPRDPNEGRNVIVEIQGTEGGEEAQPLGRRPLPHVPALRRAQRLEARGARRSQPSDTAASATSRSSSRATTRGRASSTRAGRTACSGFPRPRARVASTRARRRSRCCPRPRRSTSTIDPNDLEIDVFRVDRPGRAVGEHDRLGGADHAQADRASSSPARTRRASCRTRTRRCASCAARLLQIEQERQHAELSSARREQVKGGGRSEKIRTYNYKENRVTDHRIGLTVHALDRVLGGELDDDRRRARRRGTCGAARRRLRTRL